MTPQELIERWREDQSKYPKHIYGEIAAAAVRCCAKELEYVLAGEEPDLDGQIGIAAEIMEGGDVKQAVPVLEAMLNKDKEIGWPTS